MRESRTSKSNLERDPLSSILYPRFSILDSILDPLSSILYPRFSIFKRGKPWKAYSKTFDTAFECFARIPDSPLSR